ncbi:MAG: type II toxin-antitoxin system MqsA family antitoxin [Candidatus Hydrothermarchaeota archaeon]
MKDLCPICGGKLEEKNVNEEIWIEDNLLIIKNIHARVCDSCGEKIVDYEAMQKIEEIIDKFKNKKLKPEIINAYVVDSKKEILI